MSRVRILGRWAPVVRYAARRYRRDLKRAQRDFGKAIGKGATEGKAMTQLCIDEAKAVLDMLKRLGYGGGRRMAPPRDRLELEIMVHERDESASINFFRLFMAQQRGRPLEQFFSRKGRQGTEQEAEALRWKHIDELRASLKARRAALLWLSNYYKRFELRRKYREFARVQFDRELDDEAKVAYMSLLMAQIAQRTGRSVEDVLLEYNEMVQSLGLDVASAEIDLEGDGESSSGEEGEVEEEEAEDEEGEGGLEG